ncbi:MAG: Ig-like domain-containing protein [Lachnospiraceae bacterium]|jgi:hypothetical protein|nr:Ig-like domain-containing protein [Lachnospiraceae bacterium]
MKRKDWILKIGIFIMFFAFILATPVLQAQAKGKLHALAISGWPERAKNSQELMYSRLCENKLDNYVTSQKNIHAYSYDYKEGVSRTSINQILDHSFGSSQGDDLNIFYYAGHSTARLEENKVLEAYGITLSSSDYYEYEDLTRQLAKYKGQIVVILDTCCAEAFYNLGVSKLPDKDKKRFTCILSCGYEEESQFGSLLELPYTWFGGYSYGKFTFAMGKGLGFWDDNVKADANKDGKVTVRELFNYTSKNTKPMFEKMTVKMYSSNPDLVIFSFPPELTVDKTSITLTKGTSVQITAEKKNTSAKIKWSSTNKKVAAVTNSGRVKAEGKGTCKIKASVSGKTVYVKVKVTNPSIKLNKKKVTLYTTGKSTVQLNAVLNGKKNKVSWKSSNTSVASVNSKGKVTAKRAGKVTITAKANGVTAKCEITVIKKKNSTIKDLRGRYFKSIGDDKVTLYFAEEKNQLYDISVTITMGWNSTKVFFKNRPDRKGNYETVSTYATGYYYNLTPFWIKCTRISEKKIKFNVTLATGQNIVAGDFVETDFRGKIK